MTASLSTSNALSISVPVWRMPIALGNYPHADPWVTDEEAALMDFYATPANHVTGGSGRRNSGQVRTIRSAIS